MYNALNITEPVRPIDGPDIGGWHVPAHPYMQKELAKIDRYYDEGLTSKEPDPWALAYKAHVKLGLDRHAVDRCYGERIRAAEKRLNARDRARKLEENPGKHFDEFGCLVSDEPEPVIIIPAWGAKVAAVETPIADEPSTVEPVIEPEIAAEPQSPWMQNLYTNG
jgi:hypothetical protein